MLHARKINLSFAMATNQIQQFRLNSYGAYDMVVRGLLKEHYCKAFVRIPKVR